MKKTIIILLVILPALVIADYFLFTNVFHESFLPDFGTTLSDQEIINLAYAGDKSSDQGSLQKYAATIYEWQRTGLDESFYCTNNYDEAKDKVTASITSSNGSETLSGENGTDRYFEFITLVSNARTQTTSEYSRRVLKCSYLSNLINHRDLSANSYIDNYKYLGKFTVMPSQPEEAIKFVLSVYGGTPKFISSSSTANSATYKLTVYTTRISYGDWGLNDQIDFIKAEFSLNKKTGELNATQQILKRLQGKNNPNPMK